MSVPLQDDVPTSTYRMAFAASPLDAQAGIAWTDITTFTFTVMDHVERLRVLSRTSDAGKKDAQTAPQASTGAYTVDNRDGAFTPMNSASPYWPNIRDDVVFQELQTWAGVTYPVFTGFVDDYDIQSDELGRPVVVISCTDAFKILQRDKLEDSVWRIEVRKDVSENIAAGRNTVWIRLNDPSSADIATDYGGQGWDGTYQNGPILGQRSIIDGDTDTCMDVANVADQRASLPYKHLLTGWPFVVECVFRVFRNRGEFKFLFGAYDKPTNLTQQIAMMIDPTGAIVALAANPYPTGTQANTSIAVDDGVTHHAAMVMTAPDHLELWVDGTDFTVVTASATFAFPSEMATGFAIANSPSLASGDFGLDAGASLDADGNEVNGGIQSVVFYDGLLMAPLRLLRHAQAAIVGWGSVTTGSRVDQLLDSLGWATADRAVDGGSTIVGNVVSGDTPLAYLQLLAETEGGRFFISPEGYPSFHGRNRALVEARSTTPQATFDDSGASGTIPYVPPFEPHLDGIDRVYQASVARIDGSPQIYDATPGDTPSSVVTKSGLLMETDAEARAMAQYLVSVGKTSGDRPHLRSLTFYPQAAPTLGWPAALGLRQGDRVRVNRHFEDGSSWSADWIIEGIGHVAESAETWWTVTLALSPADPATYIIVGSSLIGSGDVLFF